MPNTQVTRKTSACSWIGRSRDCEWLGTTSWLSDFPPAGSLSYSISEVTVSRVVA